MGMFVTLSPSQVEVAPGDQETVEVTLRNTSSVVDQFALDLVGELDGWATLEHRTVNLFPGDETQVRLTFAPPKTADVHAGEYPFGLKVRSREDPESSRVEEGSATVAPFTQMGTEFVPHGSHGSLRGRHRLAVDNFGNTPTTVQIGLVDQNDRLRFKLRRQELTVGPGTTVLVPMRAIPKKWYLKGPKQTHPFQAMVVGDTFKTVTADAAMVQEQVLPAWLPRTLAGLVGLAAVGAVLWFTVLKPDIASQATLAAQAQASALSSQVSSVAAQASTAASAASAAQQAVAGSGSAPSPSPGATPSASPSASPGSRTSATATAAPGSGAQSAVPGDFSITTSVGAGKTASFTSDLTTPKGKSFLISDYVVSNPNGDNGTLVIKTKNSGVILIDLNLADFRTDDEHFVDPIAVASGDQIVITVTCQNSKSQGSCNPQAFFNGQVGTS